MVYFVFGSEVIGVSGNPTSSRVSRAFVFFLRGMDRHITMGLFFSCAERVQDTEVR